jgi:hypothetical protein
MINTEWIEKIAGGNGRGLIWVTISEFSSLNEGIQRKPQQIQLLNLNPRLSEYEVIMSTTQPQISVVESDCVFRDVLGL